MAAPAITVEDLKAKRDRGEAFTLVDVREPHEWAISDLPHSMKIPLGTLPNRLAELPRDAEVVVYCRTGGRSANAASSCAREATPRPSTWPAASTVGRNRSIRPWRGTNDAPPRNHPDHRRPRRLPRGVEPAVQLRQPGRTVQGR